jgi:hypothetical protein
MRQPGSKMTLIRFVQNQKQHLEIISTDEGIQIDRSDKQFANADAPKVEIWQFESNVTVERLPQNLKPQERISLVDGGTHID